MKKYHKDEANSYTEHKKKQDERWERFPIPQEIDSDLHKSEETGRNSQCIWEVRLNIKQSKWMFLPVYLAYPKEYHSQNLQPQPKAIFHVIHLHSLTINYLCLNCYIWLGSWDGRVEI